MSDSNPKRRSSGFYRMIFFGALTVCFAVLSVINPESKYIWVWLTMIGAIGTWGLWVSWHRKRDRNGIDLLDEDEK